MRSSRLPLSLCLLLGGCPSSVAVRADERLPMRSVVLYRSGVGYFERAGHVDGSALEFQVKQSEVGDFLASLTAIEHTSGGVRSVSFKVPEAPDAPIPGDDGEPARHKEEAPVDVALSFASDGDHDLRVAYVVGSPVWRPSYRVVFDGDPKHGQALLQAWAVVQNTSGEDWDDIKLSLTTGAPISFRSDLGTPIMPVRPLVTDTGEVVMSVPTGETVVAQNAPPPPPPAAHAPMPMPAESLEEEAAMSDMAEAQASKPMAKDRARLQRREAVGNASGGGHGASLSLPMFEQSVAAQASTAVVTETVTRYDIAQPVTIPNGGSTMVAIVSTRVPGEQAHLFAPDDGVRLSHQHPFSVVRLSNGTGAVLEKGPISVLSNGAFLGQGLLDTLPREAQAFVPFALDKSIVVEPSAQFDEEQGTLLRIARGYVTVQRFSQRKTTYRIRNGGADAIKVYLRHARWGKAELREPPAGTELAPDKALVPASVPGRGKAELTVVERTPVQLDLTIMDPRAAEAIGVWLAGAAANDPASEPLKRALAMRSDLDKLNDQIGSAEREQAELNAGASEARKNLKAVEKLPRAKDLRDRLLTRLKQLDARNGVLITQLVEARTRRAELEVRLSEALEDVSLTPKPGA